MNEVAPKRVPYPNRSLNQDIRRLGEVWKKVQRRRDRDAIYIYLRAVYEVGAVWTTEQCVVGRARRALETSGLIPPERPELYSALIAASIAPGKLDRRQSSKYSRVLRFAARNDIHPRHFKRVIKNRFGGLNACAARF